MQVQLVAVDASSGVAAMHEALLLTTTRPLKDRALELQLALQQGGWQQQPASGVGAASGVAAAAAAAPGAPGGGGGGSVSGAAAQQEHSPELTMQCHWPLLDVLAACPPVPSSYAGWKLASSNSLSGAKVGPGMDRHQG